MPCSGHHPSFLKILRWFWDFENKLKAFLINCFEHFQLWFLRLWNARHVVQNGSLKILWIVIIRFVNLLLAFCFSTSMNSSRKMSRSLFLCRLKKLLELCSAKPTTGWANEHYRTNAGHVWERHVTKFCYLNFCEFATNLPVIGLKLSKQETYLFQLTACTPLIYTDTWIFTNT